jgi:hypothetical protein
MTPAASVNEIERWFVQRGVPHLIDSNNNASILDTWTRALPLLVAAYLLLGLNALDLRNWSLGENLGAAAAVIAMLLAAWVLSNRLRGVAAFARPSDIDAPELLLLVFGPAIPVLVFGQVGDALESVGWALALLVLIYLWSSYGIGALLRWGARRSTGQLNGLGPLVAKALPLLLVFNTFLFVNAEVWEMAGALDGAAYVAVVLTFFALGAGFAISRIPRFIRDENRFDSWGDIGSYLDGTPAATVGLPTTGSTDDPLQRRQRFNIGLIVLFGQALQITLVVAALTGFFVFFGFMAITADTITNWMGLDSVRVLAEAKVGDRTLVLTEPLIRVSVFLGAFSGMYFTVVLTTDETYRNEFASEVGPEIRQILAVRLAYHHVQGTRDDLDDSSGPDNSDNSNGPNGPLMIESTT